VEVNMKKWLVAEFVDDYPGTHYYTCYDIIEAENEEEAVEKYNEKHECSYFYGECIGEFDEKTGNVIVPVTHFIPEYGK
jgi:hypothetical protein